MKDHEFVYKLVDPRQIKIDDRYQRNLDMNRVNKICEDFNSDLFNEPKLSLRDGVLYCFDGQHSVVAWRKKFGSKPLRCKVYSGMTWEEECECFIRQTGYSKALSTAEKLRAAYNAGRPDVVEMVVGAKQAGYIVDFSNNKNPDVIVCVATLHKAHMTLGLQMYIEMLKTIHTIWPSSKESVDMKIIGAFMLFYKKYADKFNSLELIKSLKFVSPNEIIMNAQQPKGNRERARVILEYYNKKRRSNRLQDVL